MRLAKNNTLVKNNSSSYIFRLLKDFKINVFVYIMAIPVIVYFLVFHYAPMYGVIISFKEFNPRQGILHSPWVGFKQFTEFFKSYYCFRVIKNTILINVYGLLWGFPAPIILALLLNELRSNKFKRVVQTVTYLPHFISLVIVCGIIKDFTASDGIINYIFSYFGYNSGNMLVKTELFRTIYIASGIWQHIGWDSIIYLAALAGIDANLYEAAMIDGAGRFRQLIHITLTGIAPTITILLILRIGNMMSVGFEKIILLYNPMTYETADVISSYVYRKGLLEFSYSYSAAVGLFNSIINFCLLIFANKMSRKFSENSLW